ncbi:TIGR00645 family protein [Thiofilum flexile]|uniref:TIGR00645 family protein n=1 Tax=Thiofilum flexile TaxID=125627 RepID=UPI001FE23625|nr:TIGR00645 family protein [Thiofilum flexile]
MMSLLKKAEHAFEHLLFTSRWLLVPIYFGLVISLALMLFKFGKQMWILFSTILEATSQDLIVGVLTLVDVSLVMNLLIIIIFSGYENFVSKMDDLHDHADRPDWMGQIGFSDLKIKLIGSMVAISGIELLKGFMGVSLFLEQGGMTPEQSTALIWMVVLHMTFVISGLLYAVMDRLAAH